jgi:hypothetical protein
MKSSLVFTSILSAALAKPLLPPINPPAGQAGAECSLRTSPNQFFLACAEDLECKGDPATPDAIKGTCTEIVYGKAGDECGKFTTVPQPPCGTWLKCELDRPEVPDLGGKCVEIPTGEEGAKCGIPGPIPIASIPCNEGLDCLATGANTYSDKQYGVCTAPEPAPGTEGAPCTDPVGEDGEGKCNDGFTCVAVPDCPDCPKTCSGIVTIMPVPNPTRRSTTTKSARRQAIPDQTPGEYGDACTFSDSETFPSTLPPCSQGLECVLEDGQSPPIIETAPIIGVCKGTVCGGLLGAIRKCDEDNGWTCELDAVCLAEGTSDCEGRCVPGKKYI